MSFDFVYFYNRLFDLLMVLMPSSPDVIDRKKKKWKFAKKSADVYNAPLCTEAQSTFFCKYTELALPPKSA